MNKSQKVVLGMFSQGVDFFSCKDCKEYAFATGYCCGHFNDFCHATMQSEKDVTREEKSS